MATNKQASAISSTDALRWNSVTFGDSVYTVERAPELLAKIDLSLINISNAFDKLPHKNQCCNCKMYFEKTSVTTYVPNHRIIDYQRSNGVKIEGTRYNTASYLYTNSSVCTFCEQLFNKTDYVPPIASPKTTKNRQLNRSQSMSMSLTTVTEGNTNLNLNKSMSLIDDPDGLQQLADDAQSVATFNTIETKSSYGGSLARKNNNTNNTVDTVPNTKNGLTLKIYTPITRANIATNNMAINRVYQSSEVDDMKAENAITVPYLKASRTRREVDPWWEIDLTQSYDIHSIEMDIMAQKAQNIEANILLLKKPYGFEQPFLDQIRMKALTHKEFIIDEVLNEKKFQKISWILPPGSQPVAIRVQLCGINTLQLNEVKIFLGDQYVKIDNNNCMKITKDSFATVSPVKVKQSLDNMMSHHKKRELTAKNLKKMIKPKTDTSQLSVMNTMGKLEMNVDKAYAKQRAWKIHTKNLSIKVFNFNDIEILEIYNVIFKTCCIEGCTNGNVKGSGNNLPSGKIYNEKIASKLGHSAAIDVDETKLMDTVLIQHYPRVDLIDVYNKIRAMLLMIQSFGNHPKPSWVGELQSNLYIYKYATQQDFQENLNYFKEIINSIEIHWNESEKQYRDRKGIPRPGKKDPSKERGASWSQFLILFSLFLNKKSELIPEYAFNVLKLLKPTKVTISASVSASITANNSRPNTRQFDTDPVRSDSPLGGSRPTTVGAGDYSAPSTAEAKNRRGTMLRRSGGVGMGLVSSGGSGELGIYIKPTLTTLDDGTTGALIPFSGKLMLVDGAQLSKFGSIGFDGGVIPNVTETTTPLLHNARDPAIPPLDSRFAEYKLTNFKKRFHSEFVFPKELTLDFTKILLNDQKARAAGKRSVTAIEPTNTNTDDGDDDGGIGILDDDGNMSYNGVTGNKHHNEPIDMQQILDMNIGSTSLIKEKEDIDSDSVPVIKVMTSADEYGAPRTCTLCQKRYAYSATNFKVLFKHVITIRRHWDPKLVSKDIEMLEQGTSMFNLVTVCGFCNQLFHPDFAGGIFFPIVSKPKYLETGKPIVPDANLGPVRQSPFFDGRFPDRRITGEVFNEMTTCNIRKLAKTAAIVADNIRLAKLQEADMIAKSEKLSSPQGKNKEE
jgi:hypothetical protein